MSQAVMLVLAATFALAGLGKLRDRTAFERVIAAIAPRSAAPALAVAVPAAELALAVALASGVQPRAVALLALAALAALSWALVRLRARPHVASCNCFGATAGDPTAGLVRNAVLAALALVLAIAPHGAAWAVPVADAVAATTVAIGAFCAWSLVAALAPASRPARR